MSKQDELSKLLCFIYKNDKIENKMPFQRATVMLAEMKKFIERYSEREIYHENK